MDRLIRKLKRLQKMEQGEKAKVLLREQRYFETNRSRCNYPTFEKTEWPIGSGAVEGSCKNLIKERMAVSGQHWICERMEGMAALRSIFFNGDWDLLWKWQAA